MPAIQLLFNEPRTELAKTGWAASRIASSIRAAKRSRVPSGDTCIWRMTECDFPENLWRDPDTGYILMRPSSLSDNFAESSSFYSARIPLSALTVPSAVSGVPVFDEPADPATGKPKLITLQRFDETTAVPKIGGVATRYENVHTVSNADSMVFVAQTAPLLINEGFTLTVQPSGLATDRASAWLGVMFGERYYLQLGMNGSAALWEFGALSCETGVAADDWVRRARFEYAQGGVDHTQAFTITVMPWGMEFISILFSQSPQPSQPAKASGQQVETNTFTFKVSQRDGSKPRFDVAHNHYVKIEPAPVRIAMRKLNYQYAFALAKLRFPSSVAFSTMPETLDEPKNMPLTITPIGFYPASSNITADKVDEAGDTYNQGVDLKFCPVLTFTSGGSGVYTPELWGVEMEIRETLFTTSSPVDVYDASELWTSLTWRETCHPDSSTLSIVMRRDADWRNLLKLDAGLSLIVDGDRRFEGYVETYRPHFDGIPFNDTKRAILAETPGTVFPDALPLRDNPIAEDLWTRLNGCSTANFKSLTRRYIGEVLRDGFRRAGFQDSEVDIASPLDVLEIGGFERADDWKMPSEDSTVGDLFRRLISTYALQFNRDLRIVRRAGKWYCYLAPRWTSGDTPKIAFMLSSDVLGYQPGQFTDEERWKPLENEHNLLVKSHPEIYVTRPEFNSLSVVSSDQAGGQALGLAAFIAPDPRMLNDPAFLNYFGRTIHRTMGPSEAGFVTTQNEVERFARRVYDDAFRVARSWSHQAEWQPFVRPDDFAWIVGKDPQGFDVSYGVWRIEEVQIDVTADDKDDAEYSRRFTWNAEYTLSWAGVYETDSVPMFSDIVPA